MNILMATTEYPPGRLGGSAESVRLTAEALVARGHRVGVVTPQWSHDPGEEREVINGVAVERFTGRLGLPWRWGSEREVSGFRFQAAAAQTLRIAATAGAGCDVIHAQDRRMLVPVYRAARRARRPSILTLRDIGLRCPIATCLVIERPGGTIPESCGARRLWSTCGPLYRGRYGLANPYTEEPRAFKPRTRLVGRYAMLALERTIARRFERIAYVSRGLAEHYAKVFPRRNTVLYSPNPFGPRWGLEKLRFPGDPPTILYSPVAPVAPHSCNPWSPRVVLYVGKPSPGKGWEDFVDAAGLVTDFGRDRVADFVQIGAAPAVPPPWVTSIGPVSSDGVETWRCRAAVCVVPSRQADALPRVALEAMAHGAPVVGTAVGGIPEALSGHGWLVPAGDPKRLAQAIRESLASPWDEERREERRRATRERFGVTAVAEAHEQLYEEVL